MFYDGLESRPKNLRHRTLVFGWIRKQDPAVEIEIKGLCARLSQSVNKGFPDRGEQNFFVTTCHFSDLPASEESDRSVGYEEGKNDHGHAVNFEARWGKEVQVDHPERVKGPGYFSRDQNQSEKKHLELEGSDVPHPEIQVDN